jgi:hypothetical protein
MAHYAFLDENNIVTEVIVGVDENVTQTDLDGTEVGGSGEAWEEFYGNLRGQTCKRTSYNTINGQHISGGVPFRNSFASVGYPYNPELDKFKPAPVNPVWIFNEETYVWEDPNPMPGDGRKYFYNYETNEWELTAEELLTGE